MPNELRAVLSGQDQVLTRAQALQGGLSPGQVRWRLRSRRWQALHPGVYVAHSGPASTTQREWAALLYAGPGACLGCHTGASRDGLVGYEAAAIHVLVPEDRRVRRQPGLLLHRSRSLGDWDVHPVRQPRRTRLSRSILDIAGHARNNDDARAVLAAGVQQRLTTAAQLRTALLRLGPRPHRRLLLATLADIEGGSQALPELQALDVLRRAGLPLPDVRQKCLRFGRYFLDLWWEAARLAVEIDGSAHLLASNWWADLDRQNEITLDGRLVLRFPSYVIREQPYRFCEQMTRALSRRSAAWPEPARLR